MAVKAIYIELLEEKLSPCIKAKLEKELAETQAELSDTKARLEEIKNEQTSESKERIKELEEQLIKLQTERDELQHELERYERMLNECKNSKSVSPSWRIGSLVIMQNNDEVTGVVTVADENLANSSELPISLLQPDYFWTESGGATLDVLSSNSVGFSNTSLFKLNDNHGRRRVLDGNMIEISIRNGPRAKFRLSRVAGSDDNNAVYIAEAVSV